MSNKQVRWHIAVHVRGATMGSYLEPFPVPNDHPHSYPNPLFGRMNVEGYETKEECEKAIAFIEDWARRRLPG